MVLEKEFKLRKQVVLEGLSSEELDNSRKGGVDAPISDLIRRINSHPDYYTTSSCSGRISLFLDEPSALLSVEGVDGERNDSNKDKAKKGGDWIYVSHEAAVEDEVLLAVREKYAAHQKGLLVFRFEPFILALECASLVASQELVTCAMASGFRESGITSAGKRYMVAIRCSIRMEVPIADDGQFLVSVEYLKYLVRLANKKMVLNQQRIDRLVSTFKATVESHQVLDVATSGRVDLSSRGRPTRRKKLDKAVLDKLLVSLAKRQEGLLSKITLLEHSSCFMSSSNLKVAERVVLSASTSDNNCRKDILSVDQGIDRALPIPDTFQVRENGSNDGSVKQPSSSSTEGLGQSDMCSLFATSLLIFGEPAERLFRWGHSTCAVGDLKLGCKSVIVFGGYGGPERHARQNDVLMLNVEDGSLSSVHTVGAPPPIMAHTASRVKNSMVIIGGRRDPSCVLNVVSFLDLKTFEWKFPVVTGDDLPPRHRHAAAVIDSKIYIYGGLNCTEALGDLYVLNTNSWTCRLVTCTGELPSARHSLSLAAVGSTLFLFGGRQGNKVYGDLYALNLESLLWSHVKAGGRAPSCRFSHTMTVVSKRYIAITGGCPITKEKDLTLLDTSSSTWVRVQVDWPRESLLVRHTTTLVDDVLVVVGGGAACFAFGTNFSPPLKLNLKSFLERQALCGTKQPSETGQALEVKHQLEDMRAVSWVLKVEKSIAKEVKDSLKQIQWLDSKRKSKVLNEGSYVAFPVIEAAAKFLLKNAASQSTPLYDELVHLSNKSWNVVTKAEGTVRDETLKFLSACGGEVSKSELPTSSKQLNSPFSTMEGAVSAVLEQKGLSSSLLQELPKKWELLGDLVVLPAGSLSSTVWLSLGEDLWRAIAVSLSANRLARQAPIAATGTRDSQLQLLYGEGGWVEHRENGILYCFDATKCMFSSGNVSEKLRIARMPCQGATVVDLFSGIGYYVLPFLIKAGARHVYACEWNVHAITALRHNLRVNGVEESCTVLEGDNRCTAPEDVADVVSLGLLPSSECSWQTAIRALRPEGGLLLVHGNVMDTEEEKWTDHLSTSLRGLATSMGRTWDVSVVRITRVKWYAPHIRHLVADVRCKQATK